jgi:4-amino-4-deoxy-L-arabinose transferase-like glycosyltransferase
VSIKQIYISIKSISPLDLAAIAIGVVLMWLYLNNLTRWMIYGDEGEYLYQVWRMTLGEAPYRDFLTPQLPVFLYSGMTIMEITGPSLAAMRIFSILLSFGTAILLYLAGREHKNRSAGLLAASLYLLHVDVFAATRIFRNEALFVFFVTSGLVIAFWPTERYWRRRLVLAGFLFGLSTMVKLFGSLPAIGVFLAKKTLLSRFC